MVFGAIGSFHDYLLSLKFLLGAPSFSHAGGKRHRRNRQNRCPELQGEKRLVLRFPNERPEATQRAPHRDPRQDENSRGRLPSGEAESRPDHNRSANKGDWIIPRRNFKLSAKDEATEQHE